MVWVQRACKFTPCELHGSNKDLMSNEDARTGALGARVSHNTATDKACKVAAATLSFWILKVVITTVGDLCGDALSISLNLGYLIALICALAVFVPLLFAQLRARRLVPWLYWSAILSSATVGAEISDGIDRALHWGDLVGTATLLIGLIVTLSVWFARRRAIRIYPVEGQQDERYYWAAVVFANSLGSALGDLIGAKLGLGLLGAIGVYAGILALLLALHYTTRASKGLLFWCAFVVTRVPF